MDTRQAARNTIQAIVRGAIDGGMAPSTARRAKKQLVRHAIDSAQIADAYPDLSEEEYEALITEIEKQCGL